MDVSTLRYFPPDKVTIGPGRYKMERDINPYPDTSTDFLYLEGTMHGVSLTHLQARTGEEKVLIEDLPPKAAKRRTVVSEVRWKNQPAHSTVHAQPKAAIQPPVPHVTQKQSQIHVESLSERRELMPA